MRNVLIIASSFLFAFMLTLLPMPEWSVWFRPAWALLVLLYWNIMFPNLVNVAAAFLVGMVLDLLNGSLLGEHALAMTVTSYLALKFYARIRMFSLLQQGLCVLLLVLIYQLIIYCLQGFINEVPKSKFYWAQAVISMLLWPWIVTILKNTSRRYRLG